MKKQDEEKFQFCYKCIYYRKTTNAYGTSFHECNYGQKMNYITGKTPYKLCSKTRGKKTSCKYYKEKSKSGYFADNDN